MFNLKHLRDVLESLFIKKECIIVAPIKLKFLRQTKWCYNLKCSEEINLDILLTFEKLTSLMEKSDSINSIPRLKTEVNNKNSLLLCFDTNSQTICLKETKVSARGILVSSTIVESEESFKRGFYYGLEDVSNIVEDICNYHQEYFIERNIFRKCLDKVLSL